MRKTNIGQSAIASPTALHQHAPTTQPKVVGVVSIGTVAYCFAENAETFFFDEDSQSWGETLSLNFLNLPQVRRDSPESDVGLMR